MTSGRRYAKSWEKYGMHSLLCQDNEALQGYALDRFNDSKEVSAFVLRSVFKRTRWFVSQGPQTLCGREEKMSSVNYTRMNKILALAGFLAAHPVRSRDGERGMPAAA